MTLAEIRVLTGPALAGTEQDRKKEGAAVSHRHEQTD